MTAERKKWTHRLMERWDLGSVRDVIIVLIVFAFTGTTVLLIKPYVQGLLMSGDVSSTWSSVIYYILILPVYNLILLIYGFVFGKFRFFWKFEKRFFRRILGLKPKS